MDNKEYTIELAKVERQSTGLISSLATMFPAAEINTEEDMIQASEALTTITKHKKGWEDQRQALVKPANDYVRSINDLWKRAIEPVDREVTRIRGLMSAFRAAEAARRQAEYTAGLEKSAEIFPEGSPIPEVVAPIPEDTLRQVRTNQGTVGFTTIWRWMVEDESKIPREYWMVDTTMITKVVKAGLHNIPGIRIYAEEVPTVRGS